MTEMESVKNAQRHDLKELEVRVPQIISGLDMPSDFKVDQSTDKAATF